MTLRLFMPLLVVAGALGTMAVPAIAVTRPQSGSARLATIPVAGTLGPPTWVQPSDARKPAPKPAKQSMLKFVRATAKGSQQAGHQAKSIAIPSSTGGAASASSTVPTAYTAQGPYALLGFDNLEPPDTQIAAGPTAFMEVINSVATVRSKADGSVIADNISLTGFFPAPPANFYFADPRVAYDPASGRWYISELEFNQNFPLQSYVYLAVSATSNPDPTQPNSWYAYQVICDAPSQGCQPGVPIGASTICDQPELGWSNDKIAISCNNFSDSSTFSGETTRFIDKAAVLSASSPAYADLKTSADTTRFSINPVKSYSDSEPLYLVYNGMLASNNFAGLITVTGSVGPSMTKTETDLLMSGSTVAPGGDQPGTTVQLDTGGDNRFLGAVWRDGVLWTGGNDGCKPGTDTVLRACMRLVQIKTGATPVVSQDFDAGIQGGHAIYPAVTMDANDNLLVAFTTSSSTTFPSVEYSSQLTGESMALDPMVMLQPGSASYTGTRWGDYSAAAPDPTVPGQAWVAGEYVGGARWNTSGGPVHVYRCTSVTGFPAGGAAGPYPTGAQLNLTASAAGCNNPEYRISLQSPDGSTTVLHDWSASNSYSWAAGSPGTYQVTYWAREQGSAALPEAAATYSITTYIPPCSAGTVTASPSSPQPANTSVTFTATAVGCGSYTTEYEFWVFGQGAWKMVQPYSTHNTWVAGPTALSAYGTYTIDVWIRNVADGHAFDTFGLTSWVTGGCNFATTTNTAGSIYTTVAGGVACLAPEYQVWMVGKGLPWTVEQSWTTSSTFDASKVAGLSPGTYTVDVWVREKGVSTSAAYYETWGLATYVKGSAPCAASAPTLVQTPASPQSTGTDPITFTAAGCGANALYEFWLFPGAGGGWQLLRAYNTNPIYTWHPATLPAGNWSVVAWAKTPGSTTADYDSYGVASSELNGCGAATVSTDRSDPQAESTGGSVTFTATAQGCARPEYSFWVLPSGSTTWQNVRPYSSTNTWALTLGGANVPNTYAVMVWVREQGGPTSAWAYETYAGISFTLTQ